MPAFTAISPGQRERAASAGSTAAASRLLARCHVPAIGGRAARMTASAILLPPSALSPFDHKAAQEAADLLAERLTVAI
jgi:hypothetical protein